MTNLTKEYELFYFLPITFTPEEVATTREKLNSIITKFNGALTTEEDLGKKKLSFPIKGARHGYYFLAHFTCQPEATGKINQEIKLLPEILRHFLTTKEEYQTAHVAAYADAPKENLPPPPTSEEPRPITETGQVDMQELDRKIDELLLDNI